MSRLQSRTRRSDSPRGVKRPDVRTVLANALHDRWHTFASEVVRNARHCSEPSIHDLRVAARRVIATLDMLSTIVGVEEIRKVRRDLQKLLKGFNRLRDVHVQILAVRQFGRRFPVLRSFRTALVVQERRLVRDAGRQILRFPLRDLGNRAAAIQTGVETMLSHPGMIAAGEAAVAGKTGEAFARAVRLRWQVVPSDPRTIHKLRVAFKKFRYTLEITHRFQIMNGKALSKMMNRYQTALGEVQDAEVLLQSIQEFSRKGGSGAHMALLPVVQFLVQLRTEKIEMFMKQADTLSAFWVSGEPGYRAEKSGASTRSGGRIRR